MAESSRPPLPVPPPLGPRAWLGQALLYGLFALAIGVFSHWPPYRHLAPDTALVKLSFVHVGKPVADCRQLTAQELARLPPNMRAPTQCPRERSPVMVELDIDGAPTVRTMAAPSGLSRDGASAVYQRLPVAAGERLIQVRLRDDVRAEGFTYTLERRVVLAPAQVLVIDFDAGKGGITLQ
ncbi:MAG: hypothetical protein KF683_16205 [Rubrivivax sp.]|nr:hypothetical protein [Rubrivivax sp.]